VFEPGPNPTEVYGPAIATGVSGRSVVFIDAGSSSTTVLIVAVQGAQAVLGARSSSTEALVEASGASEPPEGRARPAHDGSAPGDGAPAASGTACCAPSASGAGGGAPGAGVTAALSLQFSAFPPDGGAIQDPPTFLVPPGAVVEFLDSPG
jgi:hypothetical protein